MKIPNTTLLALATSIYSRGKSIGSATLTVDRLRKAVESGDEATAGQKFDTPRTSDLIKAVQTVIEQQAERLAKPKTGTGLISSKVRLQAMPKTGQIRVRTLELNDSGEARAAAAWLFDVNRYRSTVIKGGKVSVATRRELTKRFGQLSIKDMACLNVSDKQDSTGTLGLTSARTILANWKESERSWVQSFTDRQIKAKSAKDVSAKAKAANSKRMPRGRNVGVAQPDPTNPGSVIPPGWRKVNTLEEAIAATVPVEAVIAS
jgi:hypothetical protein